jgi:hypothetical protein
LMNSLVANYLVRLQVTTHVTTSLMSRLPIPRPVNGSRDYERLADLAQQISAGGRAELDPGYAELNAIAARLYSLAADEYEHIVKAFPLLPPSVRCECLSKYDRAT